MTRISVQGTHALFQRQQALVYLRALHSSLFARIADVGCALAARQVHQAQLADRAVRTALDTNLEHGVGARRVRVDLEEWAARLAPPPSHHPRNPPTLLTSVDAVRRSCWPAATQRMTSPAVVATCSVRPTT